MGNSFYSLPDENMDVMYGCFHSRGDRQLMERMKKKQEENKAIAGRNLQYARDQYSMLRNTYEALKNYKP
jgi:hypothetical protein